MSWRQKMIKKLGFSAAAMLGVGLFGIPFGANAGVRINVTPVLPAYPAPAPFVNSYPIPRQVAPVYVAPYVHERAWRERDAYRRIEHRNEWLAHENHSRFRDRDRR